MARGRVSNMGTWPSLKWARKARAIWATGSGRWTSTCWRRRSNPACRRASALTAVVATRGDPRQRALDRHLLAGVDNRLASAAQPERSHSHAADRSGAIEHPCSPPFDSHVLARRSSATTVATAATGDASTMTALRTGGPRRSASLPTPPRPARACRPRGRGRTRQGRRSKVSEVLMAFEASPQRAVGRSCVVVSGGPVERASDRNWRKRARQS